MYLFDYEKLNSNLHGCQILNDEFINFILKKIYAFYKNNPNVRIYVQT